MPENEGEGNGSGNTLDSLSLFSLLETNIPFFEGTRFNTRSMPLLSLRGSIDVSIRNKMRVFILAMPESWLVVSVNNGDILRKQKCIDIEICGRTGVYR